MIVFACRALRAARHYPVKIAAFPAGLALLASALHWLGAPSRLTTRPVQAAALALVAVTGWWVWRWLAPAVTTKRWVDRRDDASHTAGGVATWLDVVEHAGGTALRRRATILRPSLRRISAVRRRWQPKTGFGVRLVRAGWWPVRTTVWASCEDVTLRIGGPRTGKSGSLACHALDAPGALLVTTSRTDLLEATARRRSRAGRVEVFNPTGLGGLPSTVRWSVLVGCQDLATAQRRAKDLIPESTGEGERWDVQARGLLALLLHAAALAQGNLRTVLDWVSPADEVSRDQILHALKTSPAGRAAAAEIRSIYGTNDRTLTSITATVLPAIRWVTDGVAAQVADAPASDPDLLNLARFPSGYLTVTPDGAGIWRYDSLYLIGREGACRPLIGALTAELAHQARMAAAAHPAGRLDPPLTMVLDEAPLTCGPIPLHDWTADMGGRGVTIHLAAQSLAQLRDVWGEDRAETILGNTAALLVFGGLKASKDLERLSILTGTRLVWLDPDDRRHIPVMTPAEIAALPASTALLLRNSLRPIIGRAPMAWDRSRRLRLGLAATAERLRQAARVTVRVLRPAVIWARDQAIGLVSVLRDDDGEPTVIDLTQTEHLQPVDQRPDSEPDDKPGGRRS